MTTLSDSPSSIVSPSSEPPPKKKQTSQAKQVEELAKRMLAELRAMKETGNGPFPLTVRELALRCGVSDTAVIKKSIGKKSFDAHAVVAISSRSKKHAPRRLDAYVCLKEDIAQLAASDELLRFAFELATSGNCRLFTVAELKGPFNGHRRFQ